MNWPIQCYTILLSIRPKKCLCEITVHFRVVIVEDSVDKIRMMLLVAEERLNGAMSICYTEFTVFL